jgi:hypothetical protein
MNKVQYHIVFLLKIAQIHTQQHKPQLCIMYIQQWSYVQMAATSTHVDIVGTTGNYQIVKMAWRAPMFCSPDTVDPEEFQSQNGVNSVSIEW